MTNLELDLSVLFLITVILIWFMIAYQFVLTVFGYINYLKSFKEKDLSTKIILIFLLVQY